MTSLKDPCKYSFEDLVKAANQKVNLKLLYAMEQSEINATVKWLCNKAGWYYEDVEGKDGETYTAFSPEKD